MDRGSVLALSSPAYRRMAWGAISPIQDTTPAADTTVDTSRVAAMTASPLTRPVRTPIALASSSPRVRIFSRQRRRMRSREGAAISGRRTVTCSQPALWNPPIIQKSMAGSCLLGSATVLMAMMAAEARLLTTTPAMRRLKSRLPRMRRASAAASRTVSKPAEKGASCIASPLPPANRAAPTEQPLLTPRTSGEASGFWKRLWKTRPARERAPPLTTTSRMRGIRTDSRTVWAMAEGGFPVSIATISAGVKG